MGHRRFEGGAYLPMDRAADDAVGQLPTPRRLAVPLENRTDVSPRLAAAVGQGIAAGALLVPPEPTGAPAVHAPLPGRMAGLVRVDTARARAVPAVLIEVDAPPAQDPGSDPSHETSGPPAVPSLTPVDLWAAGKTARRSAEELADIADRFGLLHGPECSSGLGAIIREAAAFRIRHVVINGLQSEPRCTARGVILRRAMHEVLAAGLAVRDALSARRLWLVVDAADRPLLRDCRSAALGTPARVIGVVNKYPQATDILLAWTLTGRETPCRSRPVHVGVLVLTAETLADLWAGLFEEVPVTHRLIAVHGPAALNPGHYRVPIGSSCADVVRHVGLRRPLVRLIDGGPLTGHSIESLDAVVTPATSTLLLVDRESDRVAVPGPCIRCGTCQEDCPVGLDPQKLLEAYEVGTPAEAASLLAPACIECGLCSYVCPAGLPLAPAAIRLKRRFPSA